MPSPLCQVKDGSGAYQATANGVDVTPGNTITINLIDTSADSWSIECVYTDELSDAATVTAALTIDSNLRTATFTAPAEGRTYIFRSKVNNGIGPDGKVKSSYSTTFGVYTLTANGYRVVAANETTEGGSFGWVKPVNEIVRAGGGGGGSGSNLGSKLEVFKDVSAGTLRHRTIDVTSTPAYKASGEQQADVLVIRPCPPGWYNPADYGAKLDGVTDDIAAFEAMHADIPVEGAHVHMPGMAYVSRTWRVSKPVRMHGVGARLQNSAGFIAPPGVTPVQMEPATISADGESANTAIIADLDFRSALMIHGTANGSALGRGIGNIWNSAAIRKGDCVIASGGANATKFFRCTDTGLGTSPVALTSEPTWNTTVGATTTHEGATFVCEKFPTVRANLTAYAVGDRVWPEADNRFYYECETAGTTDATPPAELAGGDSAPGVAPIGGTISDGTVVWRTKIATGILWLCNVFTLDRCYFTGFTGAGYTVAGGVGMHVLGNTDTNCFKVRDCYHDWCGVGAAIQGSDANGWLVSGMFAINIGTLLPTPNDASAAGYVGLGGHCIHDKSLAGGEISHCYFQLSSGRPILANGLGHLTVVSSFQEIDSDCLFNCTEAIIVGGSVRADAASTGAVTIAAYSQGLGYKSNNGTIDLIGQLATGAKLLTRQLGGGVDTVNFYGQSYGYGAPSGWWAEQHGNQMLWNAYLLSTSRAGMDPGPGWLCFQNGYLVGDPNSEDPLHRGTLLTLKQSALRSCLRRAGDVFEGPNTKLSVLSTGYRAPAWTATTAVVAENTSWGIPASYVEPTANTGKREGGEQVWQCTTAGTTGGAEPAWPASPTAGVTTQADGTAVWTYVGATPAYDVEQTTSKAKLPTRTKETQTTTSAASQVIFDGSSSNGVPFDLPPDSMVIVSDLITLKKASTANGGSIRIESTWVRNGTAAPTQIGSSSITYNLSGTTLDGTTVAHAANGNKIELQGSPESADTLNWRVFRVQYEGTD